ncbi:35817_t:CDS:2, partial [Gigaspora margarita]
AADSYSDSKNQFVKEMSDFSLCRLLQESCDNSREETEEDLLAQLNIVSSARKLREFHKTDRYIRDFDQIINSKNMTLTAQESQNQQGKKQKTL